MRRSTVLLLALLGAVVVAAGLIGRRARPVQEVDFRASTLVSGPEGARGLAEGLERLGLRVRRWRVRPQFLGQDSATAMREAFVVLGPSDYLSPPSRQILLGLTEPGPNPVDLVLAGPQAEELMHCFGYDVRHEWSDSAAVSGPAIDPDGEAPMAHAILVRRESDVFADSSRLEDVGVYTCAVPPLGETLPLLVNARGEPVAVRLVRADGGGSVVLIADEDLLRNRKLRYTQTGPFALGLFAGRYDRVTFDEYHHGWSGSGSLGRAVLAWSRRSPLGWAGWQAVAVGLLALGFSAVRFGPIRSVIERRRRSPLEHVRALAGALAAARGHDVAIAALLRGLRRRLLPAGQRAAGDSRSWLSSAGTAVRTERGRHAIADLETLTRPGQPAPSVRRAALAVEDLWEDLRS